MPTYVLLKRTWSSIWEQKFETREEFFEILTFSQGWATQNCKVHQKNHS